MGDTMKQHFHGSGKKGPYFEGWYYKCETKEGRAIALIPAFHIDRGNQCSASLQVISDSGSWWLEYEAEQFVADENSLMVMIGLNIFSDCGLSVQIERQGLFVKGKLEFGTLCPLESDIMGPFRFLKNMECQHGVISMTHFLKGTLSLNGEQYDFNGGKGYIETDRGTDFLKNISGRRASFQKVVLCCPLPTFHWEDFDLRDVFVQFYSTENITVSQPIVVLM